MESIFWHIHETDLWTPYIPGTLSKFPPALIVDNLTIEHLNKKTTLSVQLCGNFLVHWNSGRFPEKFINLELRVFEPFTEDCGHEKRYGFYIDSTIFYTKNSKMLDLWVKVLKKICILTHIEDDFVLIKTIGKGSTSVVYLAESVEDSFQVSVKCIKKSKIKNSVNLANLANEIKVLQKIKHENICKLYYVYEDLETVFLVMEYLPNGDLLSLLSKRNKFSEEDSARFMGKLLMTLEYLHSQDIVHRDLKLENILMTSPDNDNFKITDFGLAYTSNDSDNKKCGSPGYVAPEILRDEEYNYKIDIFSAGVIFYILIYGKHPFQARNLNKILQKNVICKYKTSTSVSEIVSAIINLMMHPIPSIRPSANQLLEIDWFSQHLKYPNSPNVTTSTGSLTPRISYNTFKTII